VQAVPAQLVTQKPIIFRIFYATGQKTIESFRADSNKILNGLRGKSNSGLIVVVQRFTPNGSENPCVAGSIPVLATTPETFSEMIMSSVFFFCNSLFF
jgi:hypothetical protein